MYLKLFSLIILMKKDKYGHGKTIKKKSNLTKREKKYCSCLMKVRATLKKSNPRSPYAICTTSLYNAQNLKRTKRINCSKNYNFNVYNLNHLRQYAREKKIKIYEKGKLLNKSKLIKRLNEYTRK